ncbi:MAG: RNA 2',3'-cyclic phosphodiesterase [Nitrososphaerota archaeon]|nr:RNA 2',3'-cyclic phosphodiesterase [Candidatus Geocrenenecus dongiae]
MVELIRTFIAIDFDNPIIVERIQDIQKKLRESGIIGKDVEPENLHLTLWFLGELPRDKLEVVLEETSKTKFRKFELKVKGLGYFPGGGRINVVWLGVEDKSRSLEDILNQLLSNLGKRGFKYDERGFTPHLTISRVKQVRDKNAAINLLRQLQEIEIGSQLVDSIKVKKSVLTSRGPIYSDLLVVKSVNNL